MCCSNTFEHDDNLVGSTYLMQSRGFFFDFGLHFLLNPTFNTSLIDLSIW